VFAPCDRAALAGVFSTRLNTLPLPLTAADLPKVFDSFTELSPNVELWTYSWMRITRSQINLGVCASKRFAAISK